MSERSVAVARVIAMLAAAIWLGGLVVLGAVVAPTIFRNVPAPMSADAMTLVFRRFDRIAIACAALVLISEAVVIFFLRTRLGVRGACLMIAVGLAVIQGTVLSPRIESLHQSGAMRGHGDRGEALDVIHRWAERSAKTQVFALAAYLALTAYASRLNARARASV